MSAEHAEGSAVSVAEQWLRAHDAVDYDGLGRVLHADVEVQSLFRARPVRGRAEALDHFRTMMAQYPDLLIRVTAGPVAAPTPDGAFDVFASVIFSGHYVGETAQTCVENGQLINVPGAIQLTIVGDRIGVVRTWFDKSDWVNQLQGASRP